jgi:hypothetical protein
VSVEEKENEGGRRNEWIKKVKRVILSPRVRVIGTTYAYGETESKV